MQQISKYQIIDFQISMNFGYPLVHYKTGHITVYNLSTNLETITEYC